MKLWRFSNPHDHRFAEAGRTGGTWQEGEYRERRRPIIIEWEPDSDVIGDFTWPGPSDIVVTAAVGRALKEAGVTGFELRPVEMRENSEPAKRRSKKPRVKLPYTGPQLWDLWVTQWTNIDRERSTLDEAGGAGASLDYEIFGVQHIENTWDPKNMRLIKEMKPRVKGRGLFVPHIRGIFRIEETPAWIFCTDDVKRLIEEHGFTNVSFLEMGDVLEE